MIQTVFVAPARGPDGQPLRVLDPGITPPSPLPATGRRVPRNAHWLRRIASGEVMEISPSPAVPTPVIAHTEE